MSKSLTESFALHLKISKTAKNKFLRTKTYIASETREVFRFSLLQKKVLIKVTNCAAGQTAIVLIFNLSCVKHDFNKSSSYITPVSYLNCVPGSHMLPRYLISTLQTEGEHTVSHKVCDLNNRLSSYCTFLQASSNLKF